MVRVNPWVEHSNPRLCAEFETILILLETIWRFDGEDVPKGISR